MTCSNKKLSYLILVTLIIMSGKTFCQGIFSQKNIINQYTTIGFGAGSSHYFGELSPHSHFSNGLITNVQWNINANYTRYITPNVGLRLQLSWIRLLGDDFTYAPRNLDLFWQSYVRNLHFRNDVKEVAISGIFNLIPQYGKGGSRNRNKITPYLSLGIGLIAHDPKATLPRTYFNSSTGQEEPLSEAGVWQSLRQYNTSGQAIPNSEIKRYSLVQPVFPVGLGLRIKVNNKVDIVLEGNMRFLTTDYLDDVGQADYPDPTQMQNYSGDIGRELSYRATESLNSRFSDLIKANRVPILRRIWEEELGEVVGPGWSPDDFAQYYGPNGSQSSVRGASKRNDNYFTTQFTISYIISDKIKCPVPK